MPLADYFRSTPFRIATAYTVLFVASAGVLFGLLYWSVTRDMDRELRAGIREDMRPLVTAYSEGRLQRLVDAVRERADAARPGETLILLQTVNGQVLAGNVSRIPPFTGWRELTVEGLQDAGNDSDDKDSALVLGIQRGGAFLLVGRNLRHVQETQELLIRSLALALAVTIALALAGGIVLSRGSLRRIEEINRTFREIVEGNLSRRVPTRGTRDDLDRLAENINHMLGRIAQLMANLQQVTNDIAHDLRTPLGRLRQGLEAVRVKDSNIADYQETVDRAIEQTDTLLDIFAALLRIAQIESKARRDRFEMVDISELSNRIVEAYETVMEDAGQSLAGEIAAGVQLRGDRDLLTQMLANLVENAARHCPAGAEVIITLTNGGDDAGPTLTVADTGPGIPTQAREAVLRRFYRLEKSRTTSGSGLGLALVKAVADLHDAVLELSDHRPGLRVSLRFPRAADS
jgi:signal transduction histidine kinase